MTHLTDFDTAESRLPIKYLAHHPTVATNRFAKSVHAGLLPDDPVTEAEQADWPR